MMLYLQVIDTQEQRDAFVILYERCRYAMLYTARGVLRGYEHLAEDAVHEAFLKLASHMELVDDPAGKRSKSLAVVIARHKAADLLRKERGLPREPLDEKFLAVQDDAVARWEQLAQLKELLAALNDDARTVLELKYLFGYKEREIAALLDITPKAAGARISRARARLYLCLTKEGTDSR